MNGDATFFCKLLRARGCISHLRPRAAWGGRPYLFIAFGSGVSPHAVLCWSLLVCRDHTMRRSRQKTISTCVCNSHGVHVTQQISQHSIWCRIWHTHTHTHSRIHLRMHTRDLQTGISSSVPWSHHVPNDQPANLTRQHLEQNT